MASLGDNVQCKVCGGSEFHCESGFYYCVECQTQTWELREQELDFEETLVGTKTSKTTISGGVSETPLRRQNKKIPKLTSWEVFNYILAGIVNEIIGLGGSVELNDLSKYLWFYYLRKLNIMYDVGDPRRPRLGLQNRKHDAYIVYNQPLHTPRRRCHSNASSSTYTDDPHSLNRERAKKRRALAKADYESQEQNLKDKTLENVSLSELQSSDEDSSSKYSKPRFNRKAAKCLKKIRNSKKFRSYKNRYGASVYHLTKAKVYAIASLACFLCYEDRWLPSDIIRACQLGFISYLDYSHMLPSDINRCDIAFSIRGPKNGPSHRVLRKNIKKIAKLIKIDPNFFQPNLVSLIARYCNELNLPDEIKNMALNLLNEIQPKFQNKKSDFIPNYEGRAISYILFTLKLIFGLDNKTEFIMSDFAKKINEKNSEYNFFVFSNWMNFLQYRNLVLKYVNLPFAFYENSQNLQLFGKFLIDQRENFDLENENNDLRIKILERFLKDLEISENFGGQSGNFGRKKDDFGGSNCSNGNFEGPNDVPSLRTLNVPNFEHNIRLYSTFFETLRILNLKIEGQDLQEKFFQNFSDQKLDYVFKHKKFLKSLYGENYGVFRRGAHKNFKFVDLENFDLKLEKLEMEPENPNLGSQNLGTQNLGSQNLGSQNLGSQNLGSQNLGSQNLGSKGLGSQNLGSQDLGSPNLCSQNLGSQNLGSLNLCSQNVDSQNVGSHNLGSQNLGSQNLGSRHLGSQNLVCQNLGSQNLGFQNLGFRNLGAPNLGSQNSGSQNLDSQTLGSQNLGSQKSGSQDLGSKNLGSQNLGSQNLGSQHLGSQNLGSQNLGTQNLGSQNLGFQNLGSQNVGSQHLGSQNLGSQNLGSQNLGSQNSGSQNLDSQTLGFQDLGSQNLGSQNLGTPNLDSNAKKEPSNLDLTSEKSSKKSKLDPENPISETLVPLNKNTQKQFEKPQNPPKLGVKNPNLSSATSNMDSENPNIGSQNLGSQTLGSKNYHKWLKNFEKNKLDYLFTSELENFVLNKKLRPSKTPSEINLDPNFSEPKISVSDVLSPKNNQDKVGRAKNGRFCKKNSDLDRKDEKNYHCQRKRGPYFLSSWTPNPKLEERVFNTLYLETRGQNLVDFGKKLIVEQVAPQRRPLEPQNLVSQNHKTLKSQNKSIEEQSEVSEIQKGSKEVFKASKNQNRLSEDQNRLLEPNVQNDSNCRKRALDVSQIRGPQNLGSQNQGSQNLGSQKQGSQNLGSQNQDSQNLGSQNQGSQNQGSQNLGSQNQGSQNLGSQNQGSQNQGSQNLGSQNQGSQNVGSQNQGSQNQGSQNQGSQNLGSQNQGSQNLGSQNQGSQHLGSQNQGSQNLGSHNLGSHNQGSQNLGSQNQGSQNLGSHNLGSQNLGSQNLGSQILGTQNLGTQNLGTQNLGSQNCRKRVLDDDSEIFEYFLPHNEYWVLGSKISNKNWRILEKILPKSFLYVLKEFSKICGQTPRCLFEEFFLLETYVLFEHFKYPINNKELKSVLEQIHKNW